MWPSLGHLALDREQTRTPVGIVESSTAVLTKRIRIPSERVTRGLRNQRGDRDLCPQSVQNDLVRRGAIVENISFCKDASEQRQSQRTSSAPSPTDNTGMFTGLSGVEVETVEDFGTVGAVPGRQVLDSQFPADGK